MRTRFTPTLTPSESRAQAENTFQLTQIELRVNLEKSDGG